MHKEVKFKINQWKRDFPSVLGDHPKSLLDSPSSASQLGGLESTFADDAESSSREYSKKTARYSKLDVCICFFA